MATLALVPTGQALTLYEIAQEVQMLLDSEELITPAQQSEFRKELAEAMRTQVTKINRVSQFLKHCAANAKACAEEIKRLQGRKKSFETAEEEMRSAIVTTLETIAEIDEKTGRKKASLKSSLVTFSLRGNDPKLRIDDESIVPAEYKVITVTMPVSQWVALGSPDLDGKFSIDTAAVQVAIEAGKTVPGADLPLEGAYSVVVR